MEKEMHKEKQTMKATLPPIDRNTHFILKEYCLRETKKLQRLVTLSEIVEEAISDFIRKN